MKEESVRAVEAANRWTDNIFSVQDWVKKKYPGFPQVASALSLLVQSFLGTCQQCCGSVHLHADPDPDRAFQFNADPRIRILLLILVMRICTYMHTDPQGSILSSKAPKFVL
jgi:hypothetical protein